LNDFSGHIQIDASYGDNRIQFIAHEMEESRGVSPTFAEKLQEKEKSKYSLHMERDMVIQMYKRVSKANYLSNSVNYSPYLLVLEQKLIAYGFNKTDIKELDNDICEKVERELDNSVPNQPKKKRK
jgi:cation transport regulator ChaC